MANKSPTAQDLFGKKPSTTKKVEEPKTKKSNIPFHYTPIRFNSLGKLSAPEVLHFRNFSANEAAKLAVSTPDNEYSTFISCLNEMVYESFDCRNFHIKELYMVLYTLHATYFSNTFEKDFIINPDLDEPELSSKENKDTAFISISDFTTKTLAENFKEPITIISKKTEAKAVFRLPRVGFSLDAKEYLDKKYSKELMDLYDIKMAIEKANSQKTEEKRLEEFLKIPREDRVVYEEFQRKYAMEYLIVMNALCIVRIGSKTATNIKEHLDLVKLVDQSMQAQFNRVQEQYDFGLEEEVKYFSKREQTELSRRFSFRLSDFLQSGEVPEADSQFDVQFG